VLSAIRLAGGGSALEHRALSGNEAVGFARRDDAVCRGAELVGAQRRQWTRPVRLAALGILIVLAELVTKAFARTAVLSLDELTTQLAEVMLDQWQKAATDRRLLAPLPIHWRRSELSVAGAAPTSSRGISRGGRPRSVVDPRNHRRDHRR